MALLAPTNAIGRCQIIPNRGPHSQVFIDEQLARALVILGKINYDASYGPNAKVYRPINPATAEMVASWLGPNA